MTQRLLMWFVQSAVAEQRKVCVENSHCYRIYGLPEEALYWRMKKNEWSDQLRRLQRIEERGKSH